MTTTSGARHPRRRALGHALATLVVLLATACASTPEPDSAPVPGGPEEWFAAYHDALRQGVFNLGPFYAQDALVDLRSLGIQQAYGRESALKAIGQAFIPVSDGTSEAGHLYVSATGAVEAAPIKEPFGDVNRLIAIDGFNAEGVASQAFALSELAWRDGSPDDPQILAVHRVAQDWAAAWSSASPSDVGALYTPNATLTDDLVGVRAESRDDVMALSTRASGSGGLPRAAIDLLPGLSGPAVFVVAATGFHYDQPMRSMAMLVNAGGDAGCPGQMAVTLTLDEQGRIAHESRYHHVDSLARCAPGAASGGTGTSATPWWDGITIPAAVEKTQTGVLTLRGKKVAMFNSTPGLDALVIWASKRFTAAGLTPPTMTEVAFYDGRLDMCRNILGLASGSALTLCFVEATACTGSPRCTDWTTSAKSTALHELGHAWMSARGDAQRVDEEVTRRFIEEAGLPTWADTAYRWQDRGVELAASTIAWALMDEPTFVNPKFGDRCDQLAALFTTLTGKPAPKTARCPT